MNDTTLETHPTVNACPWCGKEIAQGGRGRPRKFCSRACSNKYWYRASRATAPQCNEPGCDKPVQARGMCGPHYSTWHRTEGGKERTYTCAGCGIEYTTRRKQQREKGFCTRDCQQLWMRTDEATQARKLQGYLEHVEKLPPTIRECATCNTEYDYRARPGEYCSPGCSSEGRRRKGRARRSYLRKAYEANDYKGILKAIEKRVSITKNGCWEWNRLDSDGYARVTIGDKNIALHRLVLESKHEAPLGSQAAHHICANTKCVNPEHLQPVTHRDNVAEMLARHSYLNRIAELEEVIKEIAPNHEVLDRVPIQ